MKNTFIIIKLLVFLIATHSSMHLEARAGRRVDVQSDTRSLTRWMEVRTSFMPCQLTSCPVNCNQLAECQISQSTVQHLCAESSCDFCFFVHVLLLLLAFSASTNLFVSQIRGSISLQLFGRYIRPGIPSLWTDDAARAASSSQCRPRFSPLTKLACWEISCQIIDSTWSGFPPADQRPVCRVCYMSLCRF